MPVAGRAILAAALGLLFSSPFWMMPPIWKAGFFTPVAFVAYGILTFAFIVVEALYELICVSQPKRRAEPAPPRAPRT